MAYVTNQYGQRVWQEDYAAAADSGFQNLMASNVAVINQVQAMDAAEEAKRQAEKAQAEAKKRAEEAKSKAENDAKKASDEAAKAQQEAANKAKEAAAERLKQQQEAAARKAEEAAKQAAEAAAKAAEEQADEAAKQQAEAAQRQAEEAAKEAQRLAEAQVPDPEDLMPKEHFPTAEAPVPEPTDVNVPRYQPGAPAGEAQAPAAAYERPETRPSSTASGVGSRASDGQTLAQQTSWTRDAFSQRYGSNAEAEWIREHERELERNSALYGAPEPKAGTAALSTAPGGTPAAPNRTIGATPPPGVVEPGRYGGPQQASAAPLFTNPDGTPAFAPRPGVAPGPNNAPPAAADSYPGAKPPASPQGPVVNLQPGQPAPGQPRSVQVGPRPPLQPGQQTPPGQPNAPVSGTIVQPGTAPTALPGQSRNPDPSYRPIEVPGGVPKQGRIILYDPNTKLAFEGEASAWAEYDRKGYKYVGTSDPSEPTKPGEEVIVVRGGYPTQEQQIIRTEEWPTAKQDRWVPIGRAFKPAQPASTQPAAVPSPQAAPQAPASQPAVAPSQYPDPGQDLSTPKPGTATPIRNPDGSVTTERSITITEPTINAGKATNIPTVWNGRVVSDDEAIRNAANSGMVFPSFTTIEEATSAAQQRSQDIGNGVTPSVGGATVPAPAAAPLPPQNPAEVQLAPNTGSYTKNTSNGPQPYAPNEPPYYSPTPPSPDRRPGGLTAPEQAPPEITRRPAGTTPPTLQATPPQGPAAVQQNLRGGNTDPVVQAADNPRPISAIVQLANQGKPVDPNGLQTQERSVVSAISAMLNGRQEGAWAEPYLNDVARLAWAKEERNVGRFSDPRDAPVQYIEKWKDAFFGSDPNVPLVKELDQQMIDYGVSRSAPNDPFNWRASFGQNGEGGLISRQIASNDCGPNAFSVVMRSQGYNLDPAQSLSVAKRDGFHNGVEFKGPGAMVTMLGREAGIPASAHPIDWNTINQELDAGRPVLLSSRSHWYAISGRDQQGRYYGGATNEVTGVSAWARPDQLVYDGARPDTMIITRGTADPNSKIVTELGLKPPTGGPSPNNRMMLSQQTMAQPQTMPLQPQQQPATPQLMSLNTPPSQPNLKPQFTVEDTEQMRQRILTEMPDIQFAPDDDVEARMRKMAPALDWLEREYGWNAEVMAGMAYNESRLGTAKGGYAGQANNLWSLQYTPQDKQATGPIAQGRWAAYPSVKAAVARMVGMYAHPENGYKNTWQNRTDPDALMNGLVKDHYVVEEPGFPVSDWKNGVNAGRELYRRIKQQQQPAAPLAQAPVPTPNLPFQVPAYQYQSHRASPLI